MNLEAGLLEQCFGRVCVCMQGAAGLCGVLFYHLVVCSDSAHGGNGTFSG